MLQLLVIKHYQTTSLGFVYDDNVTTFLRNYCITHQLIYETERYPKKDGKFLIDTGTENDKEVIQIINGDFKLLYKIAVI
jgi:hypothetical protein